MTPEEAETIIAPWRDLWRRQIPEAEVPEVLVQVERMLRPATPHEVIAEMRGLAAHYRIAEFIEELLPEVEGDWVECLRGFPAWCIRKAGREWMLGEGRWSFPLPGDMVDLCERETRVPRYALIKARQIQQGREARRDAAGRMPMDVAVQFTASVSGAAVSAITDPAERGRDVSDARASAALFAWREGYSYVEIARALGGMHHTSVMDMVRRAKSREAG